MTTKEPKQNLNALNCVSLYSHEMYTREIEEPKKKKSASFSRGTSSGLLSDSAVLKKAKSLRQKSDKPSRFSKGDIAVVSGIAVFLSALICFTFILVS